LCAFQSFEVFAFGERHGGVGAIVVLVNAGADLLVVACVKCCVHLVFSVVVVAADVVTITTHDEHVKDFVGISNAVLITFNIQSHSQVNDLQPEQSQPSPRISVLASDGNVCRYLDAALGSV
jgi:hypothetical protein